MRSVNEWIAEHDDQKIPDRVRLRIFERDQGRCQTCNGKIWGGRWQLDHRIALINGGRHAETNLQVICECCHKNKTWADVRQKSKNARIRMRHLGIRKPGRKICYRRFDGTPVNPNYKKA